MADPIVISALVGLAGRLFDKKKPLGKTNAATGGAVGLGGAAAFLIQSGDPTMALVGYGIGLVAGLLAMYKEKEQRAVRSLRTQGSTLNGVGLFFVWVLTNVKNPCYNGVVSEAKQCSNKCTLKSC